jgi:retron-type reverse transcriptase
MYENLMDLAVSPENFAIALPAVVRNQGAAGIDRMSTAQLEKHLSAHWGKIQAKLLAGTYVPSPVKRVEIPKPSGGTRMLGIPTVQDRFIQQLLLQVLSPIFEALFSDLSFGFRPGRSVADAVRTAQGFASEGKDWVVDIDITKFFDFVNHDILMRRIGTRIRDKRALALIGKFLRAGAMVDGVVSSSKEGTPQGGPLSPLLANIYLDALDQELLRRGHCFCRYADDCNIYCSSQAAALDSELDRKASTLKTQSAQKRGRPHLGTQIPRFSPHSPKTDCDRPGKFAEIPIESSPDVARRPIPYRATTPSGLATLPARLVVLLSTRPGSLSRLRSRALDSQTYPQILLAPMALPCWSDSKVAISRAHRPALKGGLQL